jgi:GNAT superfamily N-acetyltransferase
LTYGAGAGHHPRMEFAPVRRSDLTTYPAYLASLSAPIDSFAEEAILGSEFHRITDHGVEVGFFAINDGTLLTQFFLNGGGRRFGQPTLEQIFARHCPTAAYVATCDEFLLSHLLDREHELKRQAYFFVEGQPGPVPPVAGPDYRPATAADVPDIREVSGDFLDRVEERVADGQIHLGRDGADLVAVGIAEPGRLLTGHTSIGMFTHEAHRRRGIGAATLRYLRNVCHAAGQQPVAGCWYYNVNSKLTLEAAGMVTSTRLLRLEFAA